MSKFKNLSKEERAARLAEGFREQNRFNFFGFAIFDIIHIVVGIALYIFFMVIHAEDAPNEYSLDLAECIVKVILAVVLIGFVDILAEKRNSSEPPARYFSFAWIVASASLLIPSMFELSFLPHVERNFAWHMTIAIICVEAAMFLSFFISLLGIKNDNVYKGSCYIGMLLFAISGLLELTVLYTTHHFGNGQEIFEAILETIEHTAPFLLAGFGMVGMIKADLSDNGRIL